MSRCAECGVELAEAETAVGAPVFKGVVRYEPSDGPVGMVHTVARCLTVRLAAAEKRAEEAERELEQECIRAKTASDVLDFERRGYAKLKARAELSEAALYSIALLDGDMPATDAILIAQFALAASAPAGEPKTEELMPHLRAHQRKTSENGTSEDGTSNVDRVGFPASTGAPNDSTPGGGSEEPGISSASEPKAGGS